MFFLTLSAPTAILRERRYSHHTYSNKRIGHLKKSENHGNVSKARAILIQSPQNSKEIVFMGLLWGHFW